jgi:hypothetical protein
LRTLVKTSGTTYPEKDLRSFVAGTIIGQGLNFHDAKLSGKGIWQNQIVQCVFGDLVNSFLGQMVKRFMRQGHGPGPGKKMVKKLRRNRMHPYSIWELKDRDCGEAFSDIVNR